MIPKTAFAALTALMLSAWAFGIVCDRLFSAWLQWHTDSTEDGTDDDTEADHDRWEDDPEPTNLRRNCSTCKYESVVWCEEPCESCTGAGKNNKWEAKNE